MAWLSDEGMDSTRNLEPVKQQGPWKLQAAASWGASADATGKDADSSQPCPAAPGENRDEPGLDWQVALHGGETGLEALWPAWERMLAGDGGCYYERPEYYRAYQRCLERQPGAGLLLAVGQEKAPTLIVPLQRHTLGRGPLGLRLLQTPSHPHLSGLGVPLSVAAAPADLESTLQALLGARGRGLNWDVLRLRNIPAASPVPQLMRRLAPGRVLVRTRRVRAWFDCRTEAGVMGRYPGTHRRNLARLRRRAEQGRGLRVEIVRAPGALESAFETFLRLESAGWKGAGGTGSAIASCPDLRRYYRGLMRGFAALGRCQINLLRIGDQYAAGQFCLLGRGRLAVLKIGYDEAFKSEGPGVILLDEVLRDCVARGDVARVDLTTAPDWARRWNPQLEELLDLWVFRPGPRADLARLALRLRSSLKQGFRTRGGASAFRLRSNSRDAWASMESPGRAQW
ncbi:GNAT family N-acetyltransferase [Alkalilimnicola sp. S0819]|uniref:GNAT family N-acetyltransferase n=1 Tax=Alkalilimnicola sp. S0819 TaxID=2613922 RepID=UPI0012614DC4|nr:GNAT family N-acetyltransferase [Alkalilimnicola sp. S0819]KAB7627890.1 GNAT family N-acetyltransferase [Alkalilimnicola sp. S0819]MPQ15526.1 GNAT family N-acetyltransferase [Alkalilimnicola sp. S0819]